MNFVYISPQFPKHYWNFCDRLNKNGVTVLGIGDTPYDDLSEELKGALTEYYFVPDLSDYDTVFRAVAFFSFKFPDSGEHCYCVYASRRDCHRYAHSHEEIL